MGLYLNLPQKFTNDVNIIFPRFYRGGKFKIHNYKLISKENESVEESNIIFEDLKLKATIPAEGKERAGITLHAEFTNKLSNEFKLYFPDHYTEIDYSGISETIKNKAIEIKNNNAEYPGFPAYYKIGKFVHSYIQYELSYVGRNLTVDEIYQGKTGVCEHYTLLYNAMLNAIGIKALYLSGWAFDTNQTSGNKDTLGHAWTVALIDGKWMELDATWGLFEGIPAGHIMKNFFKGQYSYSWLEPEGTKPTFENDPNIKMVPNSNYINGNRQYNPQKNNKSTFLNSSLILLFLLHLIVFL